MIRQRAAIRPLVVALCSLCPGLIYAGRSAADVLNANGDELNKDGDCAGREAIQAANSDAAVDRWNAGSGAESTSLPPRLLHRDHRRRWRSRL